MLKNTPNIVLNFVKNSTVHQLPIPREGSKHFCSLRFGIRVTEENKIQSNTKKTALLTRKDRATSAPTVYGSLMASRSLPPS